MFLSSHKLHVRNLTSSHFTKDELNTLNTTIVDSVKAQVSDLAIVEWSIHFQGTKLYLTKNGFSVETFETNLDVNVKTSGMKLNLILQHDNKTFNGIVAQAQGIDNLLKAFKELNAQVYAVMLG